MSTTENENNLPVPEEAGAPSPAPVSASRACSHCREHCDAIAQLLQRVQSLEADRDRFMNAMRGAAEMCLQNPLVVSMLPKQMKTDLRAYLDKAN